MKKLLLNFKYSINGLKIVFQEHSFILEILIGFILIPYIAISELNFLFKLLIIFNYFLLLAFEIMNTAIEKLCDKITIELDPDIKKIKDLASASVFIVLIILIILVIITFFS
jgi:diacylglycerol kinase